MLQIPYLITKKILPISKTLELVEWESSSSICFTSGCFDLFHLGHNYFLFECGERLPSRSVVVVGINSDKSVLKWKNKKPICSAEERAIMVATHPIVDWVIIFEEKNPQSLIETLRPDIIFHGHSIDRPAWTDRSISELDNFGGITVTVPIEDEWSTTNLIKKVVFQHG